MKSNFQKSRWDKLFSEDLYNLFDNYVYNYNGVKITLTPNLTHIKNISDSPDKAKKTLVQPLYVDIHVEYNNKSTEVQTLDFNDFKICDIPVLTIQGFLKDGSLKRVISQIEPASGWYIIAENSMALYRNDFNVYFRFNTKYVYNAKEDSYKCNIFTFLKACTGLSYAELLEFFEPIKGLDFSCLFGVKEPTLEKASIEVLNMLNGKAYENRMKYINVTNANDNLRNTLFVNSYGKAGKAKMKRFKQLQTYHRFIDCTIEKVIKGDCNLAEGTNIDINVANALDEIGTLELELKNKKDEKFIVKTIKSSLTDDSEVSEQISPKEILYAFYNIFMYFNMGYGKGDKEASTGNNITLPIDFVMKRYINHILYNMTKTFNDKIEDSYIRSGAVYPASFINEKVLNSCLKVNNKDLSNIITDIVNLNETHQAKITNSISDYEQHFRANKSVTKRVNKDVQSSDIGKICAYTTPESEKAGINVSLCANSDIDECGFITSPFYVVKHGKVDKSKKVYLSYLDEVNHYIAPFHLDLNSKKPTDLVEHCTFNSESVYCLVDEIDYQRCNADDTVSPVLASVPFIHLDAGKRLTMTGSEVNQASTCVKPEKCWITTGMDRKDIGIYRARDLIELYFKNKGEELREVITSDLNFRLLRLNTDNVSKNGYMKLSVAIYPAIQDVDKFELEMLCVSRSSEKTFIKNKIKPPLNGAYYKADEIVVYANDVDLTAVKLNSTGTHFNQDEIKRIQDHGIALGQNVKVLFKIMDGFGYEDSVQVNRRFVEQEMGLNTFYTIGVNANNYSNKDIEFTNLYQSDTPAVDCQHLDEHGLPKIGTRLSAGDIVIGQVDNSAELSDGSKGKFRPIRLKSKEEGVVVRTSYNKDPKTGRVEVSVMLLSILGIQRGDKITGLHGNKSVVSRIIEDADMPYLADGTTPDVIFNPLGVMARENIGQLAESIMIYMAEKYNEVKISEPFINVEINNKIKQAESLGVKPETLYNPKTGEPYPEKAFIGKLYLVRNTNIANSKYKATGTAQDAINPNTLQPNRQDRGGQRISEMTAWSYKSLGLDCVLDTLFTLHSDDLINFGKMKSCINKGIIYGEGNDEEDQKSRMGKYSSLNPDRIQAPFRFLGINICYNRKGLYIEPINTEKATQITAIEIKPDDKNLKGSDEINIGNLVYPGKYTETSIKPDYIRDIGSLYGRINLGFDLIMPIFMSNPKFLSIFLTYRFTNKMSDKNFVGNYNDVKPLTKDNFKKIILGEVKFGIVKNPSLNYNAEKLTNIIIIVDKNVDKVRIKTETDRDIEEKDTFINVPLTDVFNCEFYTGILNFFRLIKEEYSLEDNIKHLKELYANEDFSAVNADDIEDAESEDDKDLDGGQHILEGDVLAGDKSNLTESDEYDENNTIAFSEEDVLWFDNYNITNIKEDDYSEYAQDEAKPSKDGLTENDKRLMKCLVNMEIFTDNYTLDDYFTRYIIVAPDIFRPLSKDSNNGKKYETALGSATHHLWTYIIRTKNDANESSRASTIYEYLCSYCRFKLKKKYDDSHDIIKYLTDHNTKKAIIRDTNAAKRIKFSGRSVISVDPTLKIGETGIPIMQLETIFEEHLIGYYKKKRNENNIEDSRILANLNNINSDRMFENSLKRMLYRIARGQLSALKISGKVSYEEIIEEFKACKQELVNVLTEFSKHYPTMLSRDPALHMFSINGFKFKPIDGYAITLHPLACKGFNADFDGDQMSCNMPQEYNAIKQICNHGMFGENLINPRNTESIIQYSQEMVVGLYNATLSNPTNNIKMVVKVDCLTVYYYDEFKADYLRDVYNKYEMNQLTIDDTIAVIYSGRIYYTTVGRMMFNSLFDKDKIFTEERNKDNNGYKLFYENVLTSKEIGSITREEIYSYELNTINEENDEIDTQENPFALFNKVINDDIFANYEKRRPFLDLLDRIKTFSFYIADLTGLTLSVWDLASIGTDTIDAIRDKGVTKSRELATYEQLGFISNSDYNTANVNLWKDLTKESEQYMTRQMQSEDVSKNLRSMINSGARGSTRNLNNICGIIGIVKDAEHNLINAPITSNYFNGLSDVELHMNSYTARESLVMTQNSSAVVGENTRQMVYQVEHICVSNSGEICNDKGVRFNLYYDLILDEDIGNYEFNFNYTGNLTDNQKKFLDLAKQYGYTKFSVQNNSHYMYINRLASLLRIKEIPVVLTDKNNEEFMMPLTYKMDKESHDFIIYRTFNIDKVENDIKESIKDNCWMYNPDPNVDIKHSTDTWYVSNDKTTRFLSNHIVPNIQMYTMLHCKHDNPVCARCFGYDYAKPFPIQSKRDIYKTIDEANNIKIHIGYTAAQSIAEPMAQAMLDTHKHLDKVANGNSGSIDLYSHNDGIVITKPEELNEGVIKQCYENADEIKTILLNNSDTTINVKQLVSQKRLKLGTVAHENCSVKVFCGKSVDRFGKKGSDVILILAGSRYCLATNSMDVIVYDGQIVEKCDALIRRPYIKEIADMNTSEITEDKMKLELWREMWRTLTKQENLMPRHIECFSKAITELAVADANGVAWDEYGNKINIYKGLLYPVKLLKDIPYRLHLSSRNDCLERSRRPMAALAKQNFKKYAVDAVFEKIYSNSNSDISMGIIGNYSTMKTSFSMGSEGNIPTKRNTDAEVVNNLTDSKEQEILTPLTISVVEEEENLNKELDEILKSRRSRRTRRNDRKNKNKPTETVNTSFVDFDNIEDTEPNNASNKKSDLTGNFIDLND